MSQDDDRLWKAEDLLGAIAREADDGTTTTERVARFFDNLEADELPTASLCRHPPPAVAVHQTARQRAELLTEAPVAVPNHTLIRCLAAGGFGQVWLAKQSLTENYRACKLIEAKKDKELEGLRRMKQNVRGHPGLFPIEDVGDIDGWLYCMMPLADDANPNHAVIDPSAYQPLTLDLLLKRRGRRPTSEAVDIGVQLAEAILQLHSYSVTHGDIKPANIMRLNGRWALADYSLARDLTAPTGDSHTPGYAPPVGRGSKEADQYALGVVLFEVLTGRTPPLLEDFRTAPIEDYELDPDGPRLAQVIRRAVQLDPKDQYGSMDDFIAALKAINTSPSLPGAAAAHRKVGWRWPAVLAAAVVLIGVGAIFFKPEGLMSVLPVSTAAPAAFRVESFEVRHYRYDPAADQTVSIGPINADNPAVRATDDVTVHGRFSGPAYFYLLSLDTDGRVRPRVPASPTDLPVSAASLDYPCDPAADPAGDLFNLSRGAGAQGFMLLASADPLPSWSDWIAAHGEPTWSRENMPTGVVVFFDGDETHTVSTTREPLPRRGRLILDPIDWAKAQEGIASRFIAFPVLPEKDS